MSAAFGVQFHGLTYEAFVGLWLNVQRARLQQAMSVAQGIGFALGGGDLPRELFDAIALMVEQVDDLEYETNAARAADEVRAKYGMAR